MLADVVLLVHLAIVVFITAGLPLIYLGAARGWRWVRARRWRVLHLGAIVFVALESLAGIACPLTVWEDVLRGNQRGPGFVERWVDRVMFYDLPTGVFALIYVVFAVLVAVTWVTVPPSRKGGVRTPHRPSTLGTGRPSSP